MQKFELVLKNEKAKSYRRISWLIIALNFISFVYLAIAEASDKPGYPFFAAALIAAIFLLGIIMKNRFPGGIHIAVYFIIVIVSWLILGFYWAAFINLVLFFFQLITKRKLIVLFFEDDIIYPSFPKKRIKWQHLNNLVLKDGLLTIDNKNNRLIQQEIEDTIQKVNEKEFNDFCREQLRKKRPHDPDDHSSYDGFSELLNVIQ